MTRASILVVLLALAACRLDARDDYLGDKDTKPFGLGRPASAAQIAAENVDVLPNGAGLPAGSGTPEQGAQVYATACAACHGVNGQGMPPAYPELVGGSKASFDFADHPGTPRTIGNYWPYSTTLYGYIRRAMPFTSPGSLTSDQTYAVVAYLLNREGLIPAGAVMNAQSLPRVAMPARSHFVNDDRAGSVGGKTVR